MLYGILALLVAAFVTLLAPESSCQEVSRLAFSSVRGNGLDLFSISPDGSSERRLTTASRADDAPQ
jgi:hypothetical protein